MYSGINIGQNEKNIIRIINTHFIATLKSLRSIVWKSQLETLYSVLNNKKSIICGDFNQNYKDFPFPDLFLLSNSNIANRNTKNIYNKKSLNKLSKVNMVCDLIYSNFITEILEKKKNNY